jgi:hypothetical protein
VRWLTNNLGLKLFSLAVATALSLYVYLYINYPITQTLALPLRIQRLADDMVVSNSVPEYVQLRLRGPYRSIQQISSGHLFAHVDCQPLASPQNVSLRVQLPDFGDVVVTGQDYEFIDLAVDRKQERTLPIQIARQGTVAAGMEVASEWLDDYSVQLSGPKKVVDEITRAEVRPDVSRLAQDSGLHLTVLLLNAQGSEVASPAVHADPQAVDYRLSLVPAGSIKVLKVIPQFSGQPAPDCLLGEPVPQPLYIPVDAELLRAGQLYVRTEPIVIDHAKTSFTVDTKLIYPFDVPSGSSLPQTSSVFVEILPLEQQQQMLRSLDVRLVGQQRGYDYVVTPDQLTLRSEELPRLDQTELAQLKAVLDVSGLTPGEYLVAPQVTLPVHLDRVTIIPTALKVTVIQIGD